MKKTYLFPNKFKLLGMVLFISSFTLFILAFIMQYDIELSFFDVTMHVISSNPIFGDREFFTTVDTNITIHLIIMLVIIGGLIFGFSKERIEDELISDIRKNSLIWAVYFNYTLLIISLFLLADLDMIAMIVFNVFTLLLIFIIRFEWKKYQLKSASNEE